MRSIDRCSAKQAYLLSEALAEVAERLGALFGQARGALDLVDVELADELH